MKKSSKENKSEKTTLSSDEKLSEILIRHNVVSREDIERALVESRKRGISLREALVGLDYCLEDKINWIISRELDIPFVLLTSEMIDVELISKFPPQVLHEYKAVPIYDALGGITLVMVDPLNKNNLEHFTPYTDLELHRAVGPSIRILSFLESLSTPEVELSEKKESTITDLSGVATVYSMLVDAYRKGAQRILVHSTKNEVTVRFRLEQGWVLYKSCTFEHTLPIRTRFRIMAGLKPDITKPYDTSKTFARIDKGRVLLVFSFLHQDENDNITIDLYPIQPAQDLSKFGYLLNPHLEALLSILNTPQPSGIIVINSQDDLQRYRMIYAIAKSLEKQKLDIVAFEQNSFIELPSVRQIQISASQDINDLIIPNLSDVILIPDIDTKIMKFLFEISGKRLIVIGLNFKTNPLILRGLCEIAGCASLVMDRLLGIWTGKRVALTCKKCHGNICEERGSIMENICPNCYGYGFDRFKDFYEVLLTNDCFRQHYTCEPKEQLNWFEQLTIKPLITQQIKTGIEQGIVFKTSKNDNDN